MRTASPTQKEGGHAAAHWPVGRFARWVFLAFWLAVPTVSWAVSLYDVVRLSQAGYSDEQIIELIDDTGARFQLDAGSLVTLKSAGVSENVIQALIKAAATDNPESVPAADSVTRVSADTHDESSHGPSPNPAVTPAAARSSLASRPPRGPFSSYRFDESGMGHVNSHQHYALALKGLSVLTLRSEAGYRTIAERAGEVTLLLNQVMNEQLSGLFFASGGPDASVWFRATAASPPLRILNVGRGDVIAYQRRSLGAVSRDRLAAYWAALLNDYSQLFIHERAPRELVKLHLGEVLSRIYEELNSPDEEGTGASPGETVSVLRILDHLTAEDKEHLVELATRVPAEFGHDKEVHQ